MRSASLTFLLSIPLLASAQDYTTVSTYAGAGTSGLVDGGLATSRFDQPLGICYDPWTDAVYIADTYNNCIRKIKDGQVSTVAGNGSAGDVDAQGTAARFDHPSDVFPKDGMLYVCDNLNNKIRRIDGEGNVTTIAGSGVGGFANGPAAQARFDQPKGVAVADDGAIYVADYNNNRIRKIQNGEVTTVAGTGVAGIGVGPALTAQLDHPRELCIAGDGTIYFLDRYNFRLMRLTSGGLLELVAGSGSAGSVDGTGADAAFMAPVGLDMLGPDALLLVDGYLPRVCKVTFDGVVTTLAGSGAVGHADGPALLASFNQPESACLVASTGDILITDRLNHCVRVLLRATVAPPCTAMAAPVQVGVTSICLTDGPATATGTPGANVMPQGYSVTYLLAHGAAHTVVQLSSSPVFTLSTLGEWSIHAMVYDPATFDPLSIDL